MNNRKMAVGAMLALALAATPLIISSFAGASEGDNLDGDSVEEQLHGMELIESLGLPEIPYEGTSEEANCKWAIEFGNAAYCLDPAAESWSDARLVGAQIRGTEVTPELRAAMDAYDVWHGALDALTEAEASGASDDEIASLGEQVERARSDYEAAIESLPAE